jgi:uncharacterized protein (TIGR04255 family)
MLYQKAIITEAVIDIKMHAASQVDTASLDAFAENVRNILPHREKMFSQAVNVQFDAASDQIPKPDVSKRETGYRLFSDDRLDVVHITFSPQPGITISRLKPYSDWSSFSANARSLWKSFVENCKIDAIIRVGLRYVNQLEVPSTDSFQDYFLLYPSLPAGFPSQEMSSFFVQLQMPQHDLGSIAIINQARLPESAPGKTSFMLDFDIFRESNWPISEADAIWQLLNNFRERKNEMFEASLTDQARDLMVPIS